MNHSNNHTKILKRKTFLVQIGVLALAATPFVTIASDPTPTTPNTNYDTEAINNVTNSDLKLPTSDAKVLPSEVKKPRPWVTSSGVECQFTVWTPNDDAGTLTWTVSLTRGIGETKTLTDKISGYLTTALASEFFNNLQVQVKNLNLPLGDPNILATSVKRIQHVKDTSSSYEYYVSDWQPDNRLGTIDLNLRLRKWKMQRNFNVTISGYKIIDYHYKSLINIVQASDLNLPAGDPTISAGSVNAPNEGATTSGFNYEFTSWKQDATAGVIIWQARLTKGAETLRIMSGTIVGYQTTWTARELDNYLINLVTTSDLKLPASDVNVLPLQVEKPQPWVTSSGVGCQFTGWTPDDGAGTLTWTVSLTRGNGTPRILTGTLSGFQTLAERDTKLINEVKASHLSYLYSNSDPNQLPKIVDAPPNLDFTSYDVRYSLVSWTPDDATGTIKWSARLTKGDGTPRILKSTLSGFKTSKYHYTKLINNVKVEDLNLPPIDSNQLPSSINKPNKSTTSSGIDYEFTSWEQDNATGTIVWLANLTKKDGIPRRLSGTLSGFQTSDTKLIEDVEATDLNLPASDASALPNTIEKPNGGTTTSGVNYTFSKWDRDNATGIITWAATLTKGGGAQRMLEGTISGFQTSDTKLINAVTSANLNLPTSDSTRLARTVSKPDGGTTISGVMYTFIDWSFDNSAGVIAWKVALSKGNGTSKTLSGTISGFLTTLTINERDTKLINDVTESELELPASDNNQLASSVSKPSAAKTRFDVDYQFTSWLANDATGTIAWAINLTKGEGTAKTLSGTISGYQTTAAFNTKLINDITTSDFILPVGDVTKLASLFEKPASGTTNAGVAYNFTTWKPNNQTGEITWVVTFTKGAAFKTFRGVITGFQVVTNEHKDKSPAKLSGGAITGITLGGIAGTGAISFLLYYFLKKFKK